MRNMTMISDVCTESSSNTGMGSNTRLRNFFERVTAAAANGANDGADDGDAHDDVQDDVPQSHAAVLSLRAMRFVSSSDIEHSTATSAG